MISEELKAELSQTKLELETTLTAQQKHLKELDTLRLDMRQKSLFLSHYLGISVYFKAQFCYF